jgi:2'-hydroxyisoflavone reductase
MKMNRREALKVAGSIALAGAAGSAFAKVKPLKVLILGGTGFIGPHFVRVLGEGGHTVTLFNRGKRDPEAKQGVEQLIGDRNGNLKSLEGRDWDVVIDNSCYTPKQVQDSTDLLRAHSKHYIFISSVSAYADYKSHDIKEDYKLAELPAGVDPNVFKIDYYGALKVLAEKVAQRSYGRNATIIRPSYIAGPGDFTDRFTYWPFRVAQGGEMLVPGTPNDPFQFIDARDLADFVRVCVEKSVGGVYNLCNPIRSVTLGSLLETSKKVTGANPRFTWASKKFLEDNAIIGEKAEGDYLPIWTPADGDDAGIALCDPGRAVKKGLKFRPLEMTVRETLEWQKGRPAEKQKLRAGLAPEKEAELLAKLGSAKG